MKLNNGDKGDLKRLLLITATLTVLSVTPVVAGTTLKICGSGIQNNLQVLPLDSVNDEGLGDGVKVKYKGVVYYFARKGDSAIDGRGKPVAHFFKYMKVCEAQQFMYETDRIQMERTT